MLKWIEGALFGDDTHLAQQDQWRTDVLHTVAAALVTLALGAAPGALLLLAIFLAQKGGGPRLDRWIDAGVSLAGFVAGALVARAASGAWMLWGPQSAWLAAGALVLLLLHTAAIRRSLEGDE